jgi:hypothetical protein
MPKDRSFQIGRNLRKTSEIPSCSNDGFGKAGVKGRDERKVRALDTVLPKQSLPYALFTAKDPKRALTMPTLSYTGHSLIHHTQIHRLTGPPACLHIRIKRVSGNNQAKRGR